jgi:hypothetical protein
MEANKELENSDFTRQTIIVYSTVPDIIQFIIYVDAREWSHRAINGERRRRREEKIRKILVWVKHSFCLVTVRLAR